MTNQQLLTIIISLGGLILTVTLALAGLILAQSRSLRRGMTRMESRLESRMAQMESQNSDLRDCLGRIEGYLDLLREFFVATGRGTTA